MKKETFDVQGMTCSSCVAHVEKAVKKLDGIENVNVNLLSNNMVVEYNEEVVNNEKIIKSVEESGYGASLKNCNNENISKNNSSLDNSKTIKGMKNRLIVSIIFWIPLMYLAMHHNHTNSINYAFLQFLLLLPILYVNKNYFIVGFKRLLKKSPNMDSLIALGSSAATIYGVYTIFMIGQALQISDFEFVQNLVSNLYFESAGTILTLVTVGKYLEAKSKGKTGDAISKLINLAPKTAIVLRNKQEEQIKIEEIVQGDIVIIKPGSSIPVDGIIVEGNSAVDQSAITGESIPVNKNVGDNVVSGTVNQNGYFKMKATKVGNDTTLSQIIHLVEEAGNSKAPISRLADKVSGVFVPIVITIAVLSVIVWILQGQNFEFALNIGISVLVISCPCALGLATPVAIMVGTGKAAENGILVKSAENLEMLHSIDTVVLDKTGTITEGKPKVTDIICEIDENELLQIAGSIENNSKHPLAVAVVEEANNRNIQLLDVLEFENVSGRGLKAKTNGEQYFVGSKNFMNENKIDFYNIDISNFLNQGKTVIYVANSKKVIGAIAIADKVKNDSPQAIEQLKKANIEVVMLTGDTKVVAQNIADTVGIDNVISEVLPQDKSNEVEKLQKQGKKVAFVGDGINDSPALVKSDVGIAIGNGTDIAIESADIVLMKNSLLDVVTSIDLGKTVIKNIKMSLFWAFFYNIIGIPIAAGVFYLKFGLKLNPMIGALAMSFSSVSVVTNALRLQKFKPKINISIQNKIEEEKIMKKTINIEGMQCNHCKMSVEKALQSIDGVEKVEVSLENKNAVIEANTEIDDENIKEVIEEAGFEVKK